MAKQRENQFTSTVVWTGNTGQGTASYKGYERTWDVAIPGKPVVHCSNDPELGGDPSKMNPEDMLLSALSACHMLWYLHLAAVAGITVTAYRDEPLGLGETEPNGAGRFTQAILRPKVTIAVGDPEKAVAIHHKVHRYCYIARSGALPVEIAAEIVQT